MNFSPLCQGQVLAHGMGLSPYDRTIAVVSIGSNTVTLVDIATNTIKHTIYVGRAPHKAFFTPDIADHKHVDRVKQASPLMWIRPDVTS